MITLYGIKNCDTVRKARTWLEKNGNDYHFHDFRSDGLSESQVITWLDSIGPERLVNRRSTTWKQLSKAQQDAFDEQPLSKHAIAAIVANPTLIKRPVLERNSSTTVGFTVGFKDEQYRDFFNS